MVDIENLVGCSDLSESSVAEVRERLMHLAPASAMDQFYVASSHHNTQAVGFGWPGAQHVFKSGPDGADYMIVKEMIELGNFHRIDHVYVCSGDHSMAWYINHLASCGVKDTVVSLMRCYSTELRFTDSDTIWLDDQYVLAAQFWTHRNKSKLDNVR